ncbi:hypothetical protein M433DRAFT_234 [Acidomyces richmondensis BFW]|nr:MAG: hypothetical protein FE78DRAFT_135856 [Acidomyces sp. 'richmondensis']KYG50431.1 hypothetical protein M433DRAFT_234 [Acidomyces richmondensis BFW]
MPAPTALQRAPGPHADEVPAPLQPPLPSNDDDDILITTSSSNPASDPITQSIQPVNADVEEEMTLAPFAPESTASSSSNPHPRVEHRQVRVPPNRLTPLKTHWPKIYPPLVEHLGLQVRMNLAKKCVELRTSAATSNTVGGSGGEALQRGADFLHAFCLGFDLDDAIALLRLDDLYIQTFEIRDVKRSLEGEHLGRAIGRVAGEGGKTKFAIENASRTRIVLAGATVHILGGFRNIGVAREAVVSLILGSPPGKVYGNLRTVGARMKERF